MKCPSCNHDNIAGADNCAECKTDLNDLDLPQGNTAIEQSVMEDPISGLIPREPLKVAPDTPLGQVVSKLVKMGRNCALVVSNNRMTGIVTERDILLKTADRYAELADRPVSEFMTPNPEPLEPSAPLAFGLNRMVVGNYRHVPVEQDGEVLGVVSVRDVLGYLTKQYPDILAESAE